MNLKHPGGVAGVGRHWARVKPEPADSLSAATNEKTIAKENTNTETVDELQQKKEAKW